MTTFKTMRGDSIELSDETLTTFKDGFRGEMIRAHEPAYDGARAIWNSLIDKRPALIARCAGVADVVEAVKFARDHRLSLAIRGGGHNVSGSALCDGGLVIDLSRMRAIHIDHRRRSVNVQGGLRLPMLIARRHCTVGLQLAVMSPIPESLA